MRTDFHSRNLRVGFSPVGLRTAVKTSVLVLPLAAVAGGLFLSAQSHAQSHSNEKWAQKWRQEWLAKHGKKAPVSPAAQSKTTPPVPVSTPAAVNATATDAGVKPVPSSTSASTPAVSKPTTSSAPVPASVPTATTGAKSVIKTGTAAGVSPTPALKPNSPASGSQPSVPDASLLAQTKPDVYAPNDPAMGSALTGAHTRESPMASVGDSWKMIVYLLPVLLVIMGCLNLIKRFQARTGRLPGGFSAASQGRNSTARREMPGGSGGIWNALVGSFHLNNARNSGGSNIRLIESMPIGGANVHLLEVRGRVLLLGASPAGLNLLTEFEESNNADSTDFRDLLHAAASDMDAMDYEQDDLPATAAVSTLEELMRETGQSVVNNARRLRTVREVEIDD